MEGPILVFPAKRLTKFCYLQGRIRTSNLTVAFLHLRPRLVRGGVSGASSPGKFLKFEAWNCHFQRSEHRN